MTNKKSSKIAGWFIFCFVLIVVSLAIGYISLGSNIDFDVYKSLEGDSASTAATIKSIQENGLAGIWFNPRTGAPEIAATLDANAVDIMMSLFIWCISLFVKSTPRIQYIYFILTFALNAVSMAMLLRKVKIKYEVVFVCSILFTAVPYHFYRGLPHAVLTNYMYVAISVYLSLYILGVVQEAKRERWKICVCCILLGLGFGYYYAFGLIVMAVAYLISIIKSEDKKAVLRKMWILGFLLLTIFISLIPKIGYSVVHGKNQIAMQRSFTEQELYGLKIIQMLLPPSYSRFSVLRELNQEYTSQAPLITENSAANLGFIPSIGFLILCAALIWSFASGKKKVGDEWMLIDFASLTTLILVLFGSIGGFGEIFNYFVTPQIRCYNRMSIYIAGLSLLVIAVLLNKLAFAKRWVSYVFCCIILVLGLADQVDFADSSWIQTTKNPQKVYQEFFAKTEEGLEKGAMVYQLPYVDYPENGWFDYKHFSGYLFTDTLRWSYGGIKGRNLAAGKLNIDEGMSWQFLKGVKEAGFSAVYIDLAGYQDGGSNILSFYDSVGIEPIVSEDKMLYLYDISDIEISEEETTAGYLFVNIWADTYNLEMDVSKKAAIAEGIKAKDQKVYSELYLGIADSDMIIKYSDAEYIDFLYASLLGRSETDDERNYWISVMQNGSDRKDVFSSFLSSYEFRIRYGFEDAAE